jgi:trk system potassium uptake protein TrkA
MVVDKDETLIQQISSEVTDAVAADITSESCVGALGVRDFDAVVLAIGVDVQASIMAAILLIEREARYIVAKAQTDLHGKVLEKIGVNRVIYPEREMGHKIARSLIAPSIIDMIDLSNDYSVVELRARADMVGKSLQELNLRSRYGISVIALRRNNGGETNISPLAEEVVETGDIIVAIGENRGLRKLKWI